MLIRVLMVAPCPVALLSGLTEPVDPAITHWPDGAPRDGKHVLRGA